MRVRAEIIKHDGIEKAAAHLSSAKKDPVEEMDTVNPKEPVYLGACATCNTLMPLLQNEHGTGPTQGGLCQQAHFFQLSPLATVCMVNDSFD